MTHLARGIAVPTLALTFLLSSAAAVRGQTPAWDQAKATELANQLAKTSSELYDTFYKQPVPSVASGQSKAYHKLKDQVRRIRTEARVLAKRLGKGEGRAETQGNFDFLMQVVRAAEDNARKVYSTTPVREKADAARAVLTQLAAYYEQPEATP
jgi:hypothetical protein